MLFLEADISGNFQTESVQQSNLERSAPVRAFHSTKDLLPRSLAGARTRACCSDNIL